MEKRNKHYGVIVAWAEGAEIEFKNLGGTWLPATNPNFSQAVEYRIKPTKTPDQLEYEQLEKEVDSKLARMRELLRAGVWDK